MMNSTSGFQNSDTQCDVIIVGAGLSGLSAARELKAKGKDIIVLEARERVGGRVHTINSNNNQPFDLGGQWVGPTQNNILKLISEFNLQLYPQYEEGNAILELKGVTSQYGGSITRINDFGEGKLSEISTVAKKIDLLASYLDDKGDTSSDELKELESISLAQWTEKNIQSEVAREVFRAVVYTIVAAPLEHINALFFMWFVKCCGGYRPLVFTRGGAQQDKIKGGAQQIADRLAEIIGNEKIHFNTAVTGITQDTNGVKVFTNSGKCFTAKYCVSSIPILQCLKIEFNPPLPTERVKILQQMEMGKVVKVLVSYSSPFWRKKSLSGETMSDAFPLSFTFEYNSEGTLVCYITSHAVEFSKLSVEQRKEAVTNHLVKLFGTEASLPIGYLEKNWCEDEWSEGAYFALMKQCTHLKDMLHLRTPFGRIHWAGTETATQWYGYMDGAIDSGFRCAHEIFAQ